jgi:hypothetical protein
MMVDRMGHALPISMWTMVIDAISRHAHGAKMQQPLPASAG